MECRDEDCQERIGGTGANQPRAFNADVEVSVFFSFRLAIHNTAVLGAAAAADSAASWQPMAIRTNKGSGGGAETCAVGHP